MKSKVGMNNNYVYFYNFYQLLRVFNMKTIILLISSSLVLVSCSKDFETANQNRKEVLNTDFGMYGFNDININDKFSSKLVEISDSRIDDCFMAQKKSADKDVDFQIMNDQISVISSMENGRSSYTGVKVGDDEKMIYFKHKSKKFKKLENPYGDPKNEYSIIFWNDDNEKIGTRYDIESQKIISISIGNQDLVLMEGCA